MSFVPGADGAAVFPVSAQAGVRAVRAPVQPARRSAATLQVRVSLRPAAVQRCPGAAQPGLALQLSPLPRLPEPCGVLSPLAPGYRPLYSTLNCSHNQFSKYFSAI